MKLNFFLLYSQEKAQGDAHDIEFEGSRVSVKDSLVGALEGNKGPWMDDNNDLNPCWPTLLSGMCLFYNQTLSYFHLCGLFTKD